MSALSTKVHLVNGNTEHTERGKMFYLIEAEAEDGYETIKSTSDKEEMYKIVKGLMQDDFTEFRIYKQIDLCEFEELDIALVKSALRHPARANY